MAEQVENEPVIFKHPREIVTRDILVHALQQNTDALYRVAELLETKKRRIF